MPKDRRYSAQLQGKPAALANVTRDLLIRNFILFQFTTVTVTADVVEFTE